MYCRSDHNENFRFEEYNGEEYDGQYGDVSISGLKKTPVRVIINGNSYRYYICGYI